MAKMGRTIRGMKVRTGAPVAKAKPKAARAVVKGRMTPLLLPAIEEALCESRGTRRHEWVRASMVHRYCARAEAIESVYGDPDRAYAVGMGVSEEAGPLSLHLGATFAIGHGMHHHYQNNILGPAGVWWGQWKCLSCNARWGDNAPEFWVQHPSVTEAEPTHSTGFSHSCSHFHIELIEADMHDVGLHIGGHIDGGVRTPKGTMLGGEIKSISKGEFDKLTKPYAYQVIQASIYCYLFNLPAMVFLYISKGWHPVWDYPKKKVGTGFGHGPFKEFVVRPNPQVIRELRLGRERIVEAVENSKVGLPVILPPREKCNKDTCVRSRECAVAAICWSS